MLFPSIGRRLVNFNISFKERRGRDKIQFFPKKHVAADLKIQPPRDIVKYHPNKYSSAVDRWMMGKLVSRGLLVKIRRIVSCVFLKNKSYLLTLDLSLEGWEMITLIKVQNSFKIVIASLSKTGERRMANDFPRENRWKIRIFFFSKVSTLLNSNIHEI